ncbi:hypothetical protein SLEP1_g26512 [Rubroshorea leprosula]|uniref:Uncharacterized protein n=1 Tax=Rubroshorea leprosula TaxID=152421 RepID=A0AAV5JM40_9ROSI|nr:hypothetical protein SLEP1_g26512 [Rubroshorea leprosula]
MGGNKESRKVGWDVWERVCKNKLEGCLGIKNFSCFNPSLLGKWWGRLLDGKGGLRKRVLFEKYGKNEGNWLSWVRKGRLSGSKWWMDVCRVDEGLGMKRNWLSSGFAVRLGEGRKVKF